MELPHWRLFSRQSVITLAAVSFPFTSSAASGESFAAPRDLRARSRREEMHDFVANRADFFETVAEHGAVERQMKLIPSLLSTDLSELKQMWLR